MGQSLAGLNTVNAWSTSVRIAASGRVRNDAKGGFSLMSRLNANTGGRVARWTLVSLVLLMVLALSSAVAGAKVLDLYHDKENWAPYVDEVGELARELTGVGWKSVPFPDTNTYQAAIRTSLPSRNAPDLFTWWSGFRMEDLAKAGLLEDLSPIWDKYIKEGTYSADVAKAFTFDGKPYAVPLHLSYWVIFYNKKVFAQNGYSIPTTWDQLMAMAADLKSKGITPFSLTVQGRWPGFIWFEELVVRQDPDFYERLMVGEAKYTDPTVRKAFEIWRDMLAKGYFTDPQIDMGTAGTNSMAKMFAQGQLAMIMIGDWYSSILLSTGLEPGVDYGAFILPNINPAAEPVVIFEAGPLMISKNARNKADALQAIDFWMTVQAQQKWTDIMGFTPAHSGVKAQSDVTTQVLDEVTGRNYRLVQRYWEATPPEIVEPAVDEFNRFVLNPGQLDQVLENLQRIADQYWASKR